MQVIDAINVGCKSCLGFLIVWFGSGQDAILPRLSSPFFTPSDQLGSIRTWNYRLIIEDSVL
jgi:hypothetical protein